MKLSITMISFGDYAGPGGMTAADFIKKCAGYGISAVDLLEYYWRDKASEVAAIPELLQDYGLALGAFCVGNNFFVNAEERPKQIDYVKEGIETAVKLGAPRLRIFGGACPLPEGMGPQDRLPVIIESIGNCIEKAAENRITLVLENHGGTPVTSDELIAVIKAVNSSFLRINFDMGNFLSAGNENPLIAARKLYPYVDHLHAKDLIRVGETPPEYEACVTGEGIVPVQECLRFFKQQGYRGYVSLEYEAQAKQESYGGVDSSLAYLKKVLAEI
ncbi:MAG: sugar phosphate isomerase/epimerase family protein [Bacillota bacterium]